MCALNEINATSYVNTVVRSLLYHVLATSESSLDSLPHPAASCRIRQTVNRPPFTPSPTHLARSLVRSRVSLSSTYQERAAEPDQPCLLHGLLGPVPPGDVYMRTRARTHVGGCQQVTDVKLCDCK